MLTVQDMKDSLENYNVCFITFTRIMAKKKNLLICFFEGYDDATYYGVRITENLNGPKWEGVPCGGKEQVLNVCYLLNNHQHEEYRKAKKAFFVDRDFDLPIPDEVRKKVYETPCYSIENFYTTLECFKRIIKYGFNIEQFKDDDSEIFENCINLFLKTQNKFHDKISDLNTWIMIAREREKQKDQSERKKLNLKDIKFISLFSMEINNIEKKYNLDDIKKMYSNFDDIKDSEIKEKMKEFPPEMRGCVFRGKFEIAFLSKFLRKLQGDLSSRNPIHFKNKRKVSFNFTDANILSDLSNFADTPNCLRNYLKGQPWGHP